MVAEDLMVGDWVCVRSNDKEDTHNFKIKSIISEGVYGPSFVGFDEDLEPIPLTRKILKKNGWKYEFDKKKYMSRYDLGEEGKNCWMMWSIDEKTLDLQRQDADLKDIYNLCVQRVVIPCNYVHELQHALKLCGIDKKIVL